jgi:hypothetical protein
MPSPSKKKPTTVKPVEARPKYNIGQKCFAIVYHKGRPEDIFEGEIASRNSRECELGGDPGKKYGTAIGFSYTFRTKISAPILMEEEIYPSFQSAANKFAQAFTTLLK